MRLSIGGKNGDKPFTVRRQVVVSWEPNAPHRKEPSYRSRVTHGETLLSSYANGNWSQRPLKVEEFFFISVANLKVHPYEHMTGILKNSLGLLPAADISHYHPYLATVISALHRLCPPDLCIIDGRIGLEGKGPIQGDPVRSNTIILSNDALAADLTACRLMGIAPEAVPHVRQTLKDLSRGYGDFAVAGELRPHKFTFDQQQLHPEILAKFRNRRLHRESEILTNRWISRFFRFKQEPITFLTGAIPKLARRLYGSR